MTIICVVYVNPRCENRCNSIFFSNNSKSHVKITLINNNNNNKKQLDWFHLIISQGRTPRLILCGVIGLLSRIELHAFGFADQETFWAYKNSLGLLAITTSSLRGWLSNILT